MKAKKQALIAAALLAAQSAWAVTPNGIKIYINPGHGGHESNDRNVVIAPFAQGDPNGYWESNSNLSKGLQLRDMLKAKGYDVAMSRVTNTEADDLGLSTIVALSNASGAQLFFSIHSNATGTDARRNFPLMLFRGYDNEPQVAGSLDVCKILNKWLLTNQTTVWTSTSPNIRGDWSFYKDWGTSGLGALRGQKITSMLSEGSFHDYIPEAYRLMNDDFCWLEAWQFRKTVDEYFKQPGLTTGVVTGRLNDSRVPREGNYIMYGEDKFATVQDATVELVDATGNVVGTYKTHPVLVNGFFLFKDVAPGTYTVRAKAGTHMDVETANVNVVADEVSYCNMRMAKIRNTPPRVESYTPVWKEGDAPLLCNTPITVQFNWDMDMEATEKAFSITPAAEGKFTWEDLNHRLVFTPTQPYAINTNYTVTISADAMHAGGVKMENPVSFGFLTTSRNFMEVLGSFPKQGEKVHYTGAPIEFRFDKFPNTAPILDQVICTDSKGNAVAFNKRSMKNSTVRDAYGWFRIPFSKPLTVGETYTLKVSGDFADKDGITIKEPVSITFTATDEGAEKAGVVMADMDNATASAYDEAGSINVASASVAASTADKLFGTAATKYTYSFANNESGEVRYSIKTDGQTKVANGAKIGVHINGDLTNNAVYLELTSDVSTMFVPVCKMDFLGWRYIEVEAAVEGESALTGVKVVQTPSQMSQTGAFMLDNIFTNGMGGVNSITADNAQGFTVYPNPGSEYLIGGGPAMITRTELYSLDGAKVAQADGHALYVGDTAEGQYIFVIHTLSGRSSHKVAVKH